MYLSHFQLNEAPFGLTPDTGFTWAAPSHQEALATLLVALRNGEGFVKVTGEVGAGKTQLCRTLLDRLAGEAVTAYIPNPLLTPREALRSLAKDLRLRHDRRLQVHDQHAVLEAGLLRLAQEGQRVVLCIDEAQALPVETLETLRLLSNLESGKRKLLQIVFFGQPELDGLLRTPQCRALASRIAFSAHLAPLERGDFRHYLRHRLAVAGWRGGEVFKPAARLLLWWASGGVPRRANILAHKSLILAAAAGQLQVDLAQAWHAWRDSAWHGSSWRRYGHTPLIDVLGMPS